MSDDPTTLPKDPTDEGGELAEVLVFRRDRRKRGGERFCLHRRLSFDRHDRALWCRDCGADVDPFYAIEMYGQRCMRDMWAVQAARGMGVKLEEFLRAGGRLTISAKNVRGQLKIGAKDVTRSLTPHGQPVEAQINDIVDRLMVLFRRWKRT